MSAFQGQHIIGLLGSRTEEKKSLTLCCLSIEQDM